MKGAEIERLIPQRYPIMMVDELLEAEDGKVLACLEIRPDNYFMEEDGRISELGLIEHIAQSASAFAGYKALGEGADHPPVGYIGEVKKVRCHFRPQAGGRLLTTITVVADAEGVTLIQGETRLDGKVAAETQMKIFIKP